jgi:hypothetical protein
MIWLTPWVEISRLKRRRATIIATRPTSAQPLGQTSRANPVKDQKNSFNGIDVSGFEPTKVMVAQSLKGAKIEMPVAKPYTNAEHTALDKDTDFKGCSPARVSTMRAWASNEGTISPACEPEVEGGSLHCQKDRFVVNWEGSEADT